MKNLLEILNMGLYDKTSWKRRSVRELLSLGYTLSECSKIDSRGPITTMEFSTRSCGHICNFENNSMLFDLKVNIQWRPN